MLSSHAVSYDSFPNHFIILSLAPHESVLFLSSSSFYAHVAFLLLFLMHYYLVLSFVWVSVLNIHGLLYCFRIISVIISITNVVIAFGLFLYITICFCIFFSPLHTFLTLDNVSLGDNIQSPTRLCVLLFTLQAVTKTFPFYSICGLLPLLHSVTKTKAPSHASLPPFSYTTVYISTLPSSSCQARPHTCSFIGFPGPPCHATTTILAKKMSTDWLTEQHIHTYTYTYRYIGV